MPGTGRRALLELLEELPITVKVLGNWEDSLWRAMRGMLDETRPSHRYLMRQCQYILEEITPQEIEDMQEMPMQVHREIAGLKIGITHHLPDKNWGRELIHIGEQKDFDLSLIHILVRKFLGNGGARWKRECNQPKEAGTKVLASKLFLDCRARRSG